MSGVACIIQWTFQWHRTFMVSMYYFSIQIYTIHLSSHFNPIKTFNCYISIHEFGEIVAALFTSVKLKMGSMFFLNIQNCNKFEEKHVGQADSVLFSKFHSFFLSKCIIETKYSVSRNICIV